MANAKKCDRCGAFYIPTRTAKKKIYVAKREWTDWKELDLCSNCQDKVQEFLDLDSANKEEDDGDEHKRDH